MVGDSQSKQQGSGSTSGSRAAAGVLPVGMVTGGWKISSWAHTGQWRPVLGVRLELWVCYGIPHTISIKKRTCVKTQLVPSSSAIWSTRVTFYQVGNRKHTGNGAFVFWETTCEAKRNMQVFVFFSYFMNRNWKMPRARNCILLLLPQLPFFFFFSIFLSLESTCQEQFFQKKYYIILANFQEIKHRHNIIKSQCQERCLFQKQKWNWKDSFCPSLSFGHQQQ